MNMQKNKTNGFTIVELVISMIVIGILATIMFISYGGIIKKVAAENLKSDLINASSKLAKFKATYGVYPVTISCSIPDSKANLCIKGSTSDAAFTYNVNTAASPDAFGLTAAKGGDVDLSFRTANGSEPIACPVGYIVVPGSKTYGTSSFCVMKYEAKADSNNKPVSKADGTPWVYIPQIDSGGKVGAINKSKSACSGCHLISEAEWMTIAQNLLGVASNWSGKSVGSGYVYSGNNNVDPNLALEADLNDDNGYVGTNDVMGDMVKNYHGITGDSQRRTMTLSNGEVIWDFSGNVSEWSDFQISGSQPGVIGEGFEWREYNVITDRAALPVNIYPDNLGIEGSASWTSEFNNIGQIGSNADDLTLRGFSRGGDYNDNRIDGVLSLRLDRAASRDDTDDTGFRVTR